LDGLLRNVEIDAENVRVEISDGTPTLTERVHSLSERDDAGRSAWPAPGVHDVYNELTVFRTE
jgi:osmotically-inducible protein OsmY